MVVEFVQAQDEQRADPPNDAAKAAEGPQFIGKSCRLNDALTFFETDQSQGKNADGGCDRTVQFGKERLRRKSNATHFQPGFVLPVLITIGGELVLQDRGDAKRKSTQCV